MTKFISILVFTTVLIFNLESCNSNINAEKQTPTTFQANDSLRYKQLKGQFYTDKSGKLFEQKEFARRGKGDFYDTQIYYDSIVLFQIGDSNIEKPLSEILDIQTFAKFDNGTAFSKDKNHVYYSTFSSRGSFRFIVGGANPKTFKPLSDYQYGMDDKHIYYQHQMIKGLNFSKYEILYTLDTTDFFIDYIKDDKFVFYKGDTVKGADAKTFKLVANQKWSAEDKNYKYECCGQRFVE
jgi:DKNYY family